MYIALQKRAHQTLIWQHIRASIWSINHPGICSKFIEIMLTTVYHGNSIFPQNSIRLILSTTCHWQNCHQKVNNKGKKILKVRRKFHIHHWLGFCVSNNNWSNMTLWRKLRTMVNVCKVIVQCQREFALPFASSYCEAFNSVRLVQACSSASPTAALQIHTSHLPVSTSAHTHPPHTEAQLNSVRNTVLCSHAAARARGLKERRVSIHYNSLKSFTSIVTRDGSSLYCKKM